MKQQPVRRAKALALDECVAQAKKPGEQEIKLEVTAEMIETATAEIAATFGVSVEQARTAFAEFTTRQLLSKSTVDIKQLLARK